MLMLTTREKITMVKAAYHLIMVGRRLCGLPRRLEVERDGLASQLDLAEAIDFTIWLCGRFEPATHALCERLLSPGAVVFDIGANVGAQTLPLARAVGNTGGVYAFEPTAFAVEKLRADIALNPSLHSRVIVAQTMLGASGDATMAAEIYSSWPLETALHLHPTLRGRLMSTKGARVETLDTALSRLGVGRVDLIKLDVDGQEDTVLAGAKETLRRHAPPIVMELAPYTFADRLEAFDGMMEDLRGLGYGFFSLEGAALPSRPGELRASIRQGAGINILRPEYS
jgi:FkbM family methyltransferase